MLYDVDGGAERPRFGANGNEPTAAAATFSRLSIVMDIVERRFTTGGISARRVGWCRDERLEVAASLS